MAEQLRKGLEGVLVAESSLSAIDGDEGRLIYRGYPIEDLAREASYEEVLYLLWHGHLPDREELARFSNAMVRERRVAGPVLEHLRDLASAGENPMAALRTAVSTLSAYDGGGGDAAPSEEAAAIGIGRRITAKMPTILAAFLRLRDGDEPVEPRDGLSHAANFLAMLDGEEPDDVPAETFDMALVLHADHGINASTFSAMVTASTGSDLHSTVTAAIGTLKGPLHGGANQDVMRMLREVDEAEAEPVPWVEAALERGRRIPGFGHRVYDVKDPRAKILGDRSKALGEAAGSPKWYEMSADIERYMAEEKGIAPNVDFYSASMYYQLGVPIDAFTPIFALSRVGGWLAHVFEYTEDNRLIRPRARYVGPDRLEYVPPDER